MEVTSLWSRAKVRELEVAREDCTRSQEGEEEGEKPRPSKAAASKALFAALQDRAWSPMSPEAGKPGALVLAPPPFSSVSGASHYSSEPQLWGCCSMRSWLKVLAEH